jgi:hypothetical protein
VSAVFGETQSAASSGSDWKPSLYRNGFSAGLPVISVEMRYMRAVLQALIDVALCE